MPRTVVLLNTRKEQITNSQSTPDVFLLFPQTGTMPTTIQWNAMNFDFFDQPTSEEDEPGYELYRYLQQA
jgi:hypothetical protein